MDNKNCRLNPGSAQNKSCEVLLVNPPDFSFGKINTIRKVSPPLGILYLGTYLVSQGISVEIIDGMVQPDALSDENLSKISPMLVGITATTPTIGSALKIAGRLKRLYGNVKTCLGGPHPTIFPNEIIDDEAVDYVICGEGEIKLYALVESLLDNKKDLPAGIYASEKKGLLGRDDYIKDIDSLPFPDRGLIDIDRYDLSPVNYLHKPSTPVITSRGCPFKCTFCSRAVHGNRVRYHSAEYVIDEIQYLVRTYGIRAIMFWDDTLTTSKRRVADICEKLIQSGIEISWSCAARVDSIDHELLSLMKKAGCWQISFGVETGTSRLLKSINKGISKKKIIHAFELCKSLNIKTRAFFILGLPTETQRESIKTIEFAKFLNPTFAQFSLAVPYPGSQFFDEALAEGWKPPEWELFNTYPDDHPVYTTVGRDPDEMLLLQTKAIKSFYFRISYIWKRFFELDGLDDLLKHVKVAFQLLRM